MHNVSHVDPGGTVLIDLVENHVTEEFQQVAIARLRPRRVEVQSARKHAVSAVLVMEDSDSGRGEGG